MAGAYSLLAFVACALFVGMLVLCFAEVASRFGDTGGPYLYARAAFGPVVGFEIGWLMWLTRITGFAALCNLLVGYFGYFVPQANVGIGRTISIAVVVVTLAAINVIGIRPAARVNNIFTVGKLLPLTLFVLVGLFFIDGHAFSLDAWPDTSEFSRAVLLLVFAFSGFEVALIPAGEVREPRRHMPFALLTAIGIVASFYVLIQIVCIGTLPGLAGSSRPLADAAEFFLGAGGASLITVGALISVSGTLNTGMLAAPRLLFAMAEQNQLPRFFGDVHRRFHTPYIAILVTAVVMFVCCLSTTFIGALEISTVIRLITYSATCLALVALRRRHATSAKFSVPGGPAVAVAATAISVWLLATSTSREIALVVAAAGVGLLIYVAWTFSGARRLGRRRAASGRE